MHSKWIQKITIYLSRKLGQTQIKCWIILVACHQQETYSTELQMNQASDDRTLEQGILAGEHNIIQSDVEGNGRKEDMECSKEEVSVSGSDDCIF